MSDTANSKVAVFFDYENIVYSLRNRFEQKANFEALMTKCGEFGRVVEARAFADWGLPYMSPALMYALQSSGFDLIFVPTGSTQANSPRKNVADLYMAIQVMEVLHARPDVSTFVLMTGDRDFMPLVNHLKRSGKRVVAIGVDGSSSYYLTQSVDDFFYYSEVEQIFEEKPKRLKGRLTNAYDALVQAIRVTYEKGKSPRMTNLKPIMIDLMSGFDEKEYQDAHGRYFQRFKDFVQEAQRRGLVRIVRRGNSHEVYLADQTEVKESDETPEGEPIGLQVAYKLLVQAVKDADEQNKSCRTGAIRGRLRKLHKGFNEQLVYNGGGKPFETFLDFAKSAEAAGLVELHGSGSGTEIKPIGEEEPERREVSGKEAREAILGGLRAYTNYPTSFLSLASFVHRHNEQHGLTIEEQLARNMMTEAVDLGLIKQIVLENGRRKYALEDQAHLSKAFLDKDTADATQAAEPKEPSGKSDSKQDAVKEEAKAPDAGQAVEESLAEAAASAVAEATAEVEEVKTEEPDPYTALIVAIQDVLASGKAPILPRIKSGIKRQLPAFSEGELTDDSGNPFVKFKDFILHAQQRGMVRIIEEEGSQPRVTIVTPSEAILADDTLAEAQAAIEEAATESKPPASEDTITVEDLAEAVAAAQGAAAQEQEAVAQEVASEETVAEEKSAEPEPAPAPKPPVYADFTPISEREQRELIVNGMRTFRDYPAPFMAILAHCRSLRDQREVFLSNSDLRELLSESHKVGLLSRTTERGTYPTLYAYNGEEALIQKFVEQEQAEPVEAPEPVEEVTVEETQPEPEAAVEQPEVAPEPEPTPEPDPEPTDSELRHFVIETLRTISSDGAQFKEIEATLKTARDAAELGGSNQRLKGLLQFASRQGVLDVVSPYGMRPRRFGFTNNEEAINAYLGIVPEPAEAPVEAEAPAIEQTVAPIEPAEASSGPEEAVDEALEEAPAANVEETVAVESAVEAPADAESVVEAASEADVSEADVPEADVSETDVPETDVPETGVSETDVSEADVPAATDDTPAPVDIFATLRDAVGQLLAEGKSTKFGPVKRRMKKLDETFDEKQHVGDNGKPFKRFKDYVLAAQAGGHVQLDESGKKIELPSVEAEPESAESITEEAPAVDEALAESPVEEAEPASPVAEDPVEEAAVEAVAEAAAEAPAEVDAEVVAEDVVAAVEETVAAEPASDDAAIEEKDPLTVAFELLRTAVADAIEAKRSQRLPAIRTRMVRLDEAFDIAKLRKAEGGKFKSLPDFVRSAEAAGYVQLEGKGAQLTVHLAE